MSKALRLISLESTPPPATSLTPRSARGTTPRPLIKFDLSNSSSFLDKGLDAINGVGKLVEGFAVTLDTVIGQAFDEWGGTPRPSKTPLGKNAKNNKITRSSSLATKSAAKSVAATGGSGPVTPQAPQQEAWGDFDVDEREEASANVEEDSAPLLSRSSKTAAAAGHDKVSTTKLAPGPHTPKVPTLNLPGISPAPVPSVAQGSDSAVQEVQQWRRRAQILQKELKKLRAQKDEYQKVR